MEGKEWKKRKMRVYILDTSETRHLKPTKSSVGESGTAIQKRTLARIFG